MTREKLIRTFVAPLLIGLGSALLFGCGRSLPVIIQLNSNQNSTQNGGGGPSPLPSSSPVPSPTPAPSPSPSPVDKNGAWLPGQTGRSAHGAYIYIPKSYAKSGKPSSVIFLFHIDYRYFRAMADAENTVLVDTEPLDRGDTTTCNGGQTYSSGYVNQKYILSLIAESRDLLIAQYNVDATRFYYAGWSHGGDLAMKFASLPTADSLAPDDQQSVACSNPPSELLSYQKAAHVGQTEVAGVMVFPGHYGYEQIDLWKKTNSMGTRRSCFAYSVGTNDSTYTQAYNILMPKLQQVANYSNRIYYKTWQGYQHDLHTHSDAVKAAWDWLKVCDTDSN